MAILAHRAFELCRRHGGILHGQRDGTCEPLRIAADPATISFKRRVSLRAVGASAHQVDMCTGPVNTTCMSICRSSMSAICLCGSRNGRKAALGERSFAQSP
jgi:hypothetical protein